jgi:hypothetical protein
MGRPLRGAETSAVAMSGPTTSREQQVMKLPTLTAITLTAALAAVPALAQNDATPQPGKSAGTMTTTTTAATDTKTDTANTPAVTTTTAPMETVNTATPTGNNAEIGTATVSSDKKTNMVAGMDTAKNDNANALPHQRNPVLADNGQPRASKIIGSNVYNMQDKKVGSVDDVLMGVNGQPDQAGISVKDKLVLVPFDKLVFGNTKVNSDNRVILPDETRDALANLPEFHYNSQNKG